MFGVTINAGTTNNSSITGTPTAAGQWALALTTTFCGASAPFTAGWTQLITGTFSTDPIMAYQLTPDISTLHYDCSDLHMSSLGWTGQQWTSAIAIFNSQPTIRQAKGPANNYTIPFTSDLLANATILVMLWSDIASTPATDFTVTDNQTPPNVYTKLCYQVSGVGFAGASYIWLGIATGAKAGPCTVAITPVGATPSDMLPRIFEMSTVTLILPSISGNAGAAGATVSYTGPSSGSVVADGSGNYTIPNLADGTYTVTPSLAFYTFAPTSRSPVVSGADVTGVDFVATAFIWSISGNAGVGGATIAYTGTAAGSVTADGSGNFSITGRSNGTYDLTPSLEDDYVFTPTHSVQNISNANIAGVNFTALAPTVSIAEVQITIAYQNPGNYLYARDVNSWGDGGAYGANNGQPYSLCNVVLGSITLSQLGAPMFPLQHIVGYFDAVGTLNNGKPSYPDIWILPNEISVKAGIGFVQLPEILQEPPEGQNHPSETILALRYPVNMMNSYLASQFIHHLQVKIQFEPENAPNTLKALAFKEEQS